MTDRARELMERLRAKKCIGFSCRNYEPVNPDGEEAAAFIEQQAAEIDRLSALQEREGGA